MYGNNVTTAIIIGVLRKSTEPNHSIVVPCLRCFLQIGNFEVSSHGPLKTRGGGALCAIADFTPIRPSRITAITVNGYHLKTAFVAIGAVNRLLYRYSLIILARHNRYTYIHTDMTDKDKN